MNCCPRKLYLIIHAFLILMIQQKTALKLTYLMHLLFQNWINLHKLYMYYKTLPHVHVTNLTFTAETFLSVKNITRVDSDLQRSKILKQ